MNSKQKIIYFEHNDEVWSTHDVRELERFKEAVLGWRENDWPEGFDRRTAELIAHNMRMHWRTRRNLFMPPKTIQRSWENDMSVIYCHRCDQIHDSDFIDCVQDPDQNTEMVCLESLTEEDRANASVLCASKDMYEALEAMLAAHRPDVSQDEMERAEFLAEAALSKARGELPEGEG